MTDSANSLATFAAEILTEHKTGITGVSLLAIGAAVICTLALARYHRANERKLNAERELLELEIMRERMKRTEE